MPYSTRNKYNLFLNAAVGHSSLTWQAKLSIKAKQCLLINKFIGRPRLVKSAVAMKIEEKYKKFQKKLKNWLFTLDLMVDSDYIVRYGSN